MFIFSSIVVGPTFFLLLSVTCGSTFIFRSKVAGSTVIFWFGFADSRLIFKPSVLDSVFPVVLFASVSSSIFRMHVVGSILIFSLDSFGSVFTLVVPVSDGSIFIFLLAGADSSFTFGFLPLFLPLATMIKNKTQTKTVRTLRLILCYIILQLLVGDCWSKMPMAFSVRIKYQP